MKKIQLLFVAIAAVVLLGAAFVLITREPKDTEPMSVSERNREDVPAVGNGGDSDDSKEAAARQKPVFVRLIDIDLHNLDTIEIERVGEDPYTLIPFGAGTFKVAGAPGLSLMPEAAQSIRFSLTLFTSSEIVSEGENLADFGFDEPEAYCTIRAGEDEVILIFGDSTPDGDARYVMRDGDPNVYLVQSFLTETLISDLYTIREKMLPPVNVSKVSGISVTEGGNPKYTIVTYTSEDPFDPGYFPLYFTFPYDPPCGVESSRLSEILEPLTSGILIYEFIDSPLSLAAYGLDPLQAVELKLSAGDGSGLHLLLGNTTDEGRRYALKAGTDSPVMLIPASDVAVADITPFRYTAPFAALVGIEKIRGFRLHIGDLLLEGSIQRAEDADDTYFIDGKDVGEDDFKDFYQLLIGIMAEGDADTGSDDTFSESEPVLHLQYFGRDDESLVKDVELFPYNDDFYVLRIDGGLRRFLVGQYQVDHIVEQAELFK